MTGRELTHDELQSLLGAYALDAVEPWERDRLDAHLRDCPRCRAEVASHREVAALLANAGADAPAGVWDRIASTIEGDVEVPAAVSSTTARQAAPLSTKGRTTRGTIGRIGRVRRAPWVPSPAAVLAAAAVVAIGLLGWRVVDQGDQLDRLETALSQGGIAQAALAASTDPSARTVELVTMGGQAVATAVVLPDGTGYLVRDGLTPLGPDRTYQLWAVVGDRTVSAGVLGPDPSVLAFRAPGEATAFAVTDEVAGGVVQTRQTPVATGDVRSA